MAKKANEVGLGRHSPAHDSGHPCHGTTAWKSDNMHDPPVPKVPATHVVRAIVHSRVCALGVLY